MENSFASCVAGVVASIALVLSASGCSDVCRAHLGIRPDAPPPVKTAACGQYDARATYSQNLQEAYHSRATQNRFWIYAAGTVALGTVAATGGLGAAGAAGLSIALLSVSGGFTSGFFALLDNSTLADIYTISANHVNDALQKSRAVLVFDSTGPTEASCVAALKILDEGVTSAQNDLERARTDSAVASLMRAKAQVEQLNKLMASMSPSPQATPSPPSGDASQSPSATPAQ